jgi:hypothetical protein
MGNEITKEEAILFLEGLRNSFLNINNMIDDLSSKELWNRNVNGLNQTIYLLKKLK